MERLRLAWFDSIFYFATEKIKFQEACIQESFRQEDIRQVKDLCVQIETLINNGVYDSHSYVTFITLLVQFQIAVRQSYLCKYEE